MSEPLPEERARELRAVIARLTFTFAKTMPEHPHEYTVREPSNEVDWRAVAEAIRRHGRSERWPGNRRRYRYLYPGDDWRYWTIPPAPVINRARIDLSANPLRSP